MKWIESKFDIIDPRDNWSYSSIVSKSDIGTKSGMRVNIDNKLPFGMNQYSTKKTYLK